MLSQILLLVGYDNVRHIDGVVGKSWGEASAFAAAASGQGSQSRETWQACSDTLPGLKQNPPARHYCVGQDDQSKY